MIELELNASKIEALKTIDMLCGVLAKDIEIDGDTAYILVNKKDVSRTIGRKGSNISKIKNALHCKKTKVIAYSEDAKTLLENILKPVVPKDISIESNNHNALIVLSAQDKFKVGKHKINLLKTWAQAHSGIKDVQIRFR